MTVKFANVQAAARTTLGTQDFTVSGFGTPNAYLTFITRAITNNVVATHAVWGGGGGDGTREWAWSSAAEHAQPTTDVHRRGATDESVLIVDLDTGVDGEANFDSFITDGVRFNFATNAPAGAYLIEVVLIQAPNVFAEVNTQTAAQNVAQSFNNAGFEPDGGFFSGHTTSFNDVDSGFFSCAVGIATNEASIKQASFSIISASGAPTTETSARVSASRVYKALTNAGISSRSLELTAWNATGYDLTKRDGGAGLTFASLVWGFDGEVKFILESFDSPTSLGNFSRSGFGFKPQFAIMLPSHGDLLDTALDTNAKGAGAFGVSIFTDAAAEFCPTFSDEDAQGTSDTQSLVDAKAVNIRKGDGSTTSDFVGTLGPEGDGEFDPDGITLNLVGVDTGTARKWAWLAIEKEAVVGLTFGQGIIVGSAAVAGQGLATSLGQGTSIGVATVTGQGLATSLGQGISAGVATVLGQGAARVQAEGQIAGLATVTGQSQALMFAQGQIAGTAVVLGETAAVTFSQGQVAGVGAVVGEGLATVLTQGEIAGAATVVAQGVTGILGAGSIAGAAVVVGQGTANLLMQGTIAGQAVVSGQALATTFSQGAIDGVAIVIGLNPVFPPVVLGQGEIFAGTLGPLQQGTVLGVAAVLGIGVSLQGVVGVIAGGATVDGTPRARTHVDGKITGLSSVDGTTFVVAASQGTIQGAATVAGQSQVLVLTTGGI